MLKSKRLAAILLCALMGTAQAKNCKDSTTVGKWLDGGTVADNPDGSDYAADSGSILMLGCTYLLDATNRYSGNYSLGYRYQLDKSGEGRNTGWSLEASVSGHWSGLVLGAGALYQFKGAVQDFHGAKTKIEPSFGGFVLLGLALSSGLEIQVRRHFLTLESEGGAEYEPAEYGVFLHRSF